MAENYYSIIGLVPYFTTLQGCTLLNARSEKSSQHASPRGYKALWGRTERPCISNNMRALKFDPDFKFQDHIHREEVKLWCALPALQPWPLGFIVTATHFCQGGKSPIRQSFISFLK